MSPSSVAQQVLRGVTAVLDWHDRRPRASLASLRGWVWMVLVAAVFFWMSNPLVFVPNFFLSLEDSVFWAKVAVVVTLPWLRLPRVPWPWLLFLGLCYLSQLWSISDPNTDLSLLLYTEVLLMAVVIAANCEPPVVCWGLGLGGVVVTVLSVYAYGRDLPGASYASAGADGVAVERVLAGIGTNENILAYTLTVAVAAVLATGRPRRVAVQVLWFVVLTAITGGIVLAESGTGVLTMLAVFATVMAISEWPVRRGLLSHVLGRVVVLVGLGALGLVFVTVVLGKELTTFSGRLPFWEGTIEATIDTAPLLGSGWGAVWEHPWNSAIYNPVVEEIYTRTGASLPHGHNLFIDVLPELGFAGVAAALLMVGYAVREVRRSGVALGAASAVTGRLVLLVLVALLVFGVTEPMLTVPLGWWAFALVVAVARQRVLPPRAASPDDRQPVHRRTGAGLRSHGPRSAPTTSA